MFPLTEFLITIKFSNIWSGKARLAIPVLIPNLEISFTDAEESEIKTIQFSAKEWLPISWKESHSDFLRQGAPSGEIFHAELTIMLPQNAVGYRVRIFYPQ